MRLFLELTSPCCQFHCTTYYSGIESRTSITSLFHVPDRQAVFRDVLDISVYLVIPDNVVLRHVRPSACCHK